MDRDDGNQKPKRKRTQRKRGTSPHRGVVLVSPKTVSDRAAWRAKWVDPDSGKVVWKRLEPMLYPNAEARRDWAIAKAKELAWRREALATGAVRMTGEPLDVTLRRYFEDHPHLRPKTVEAYRGAADKLEAWAAENHVDTVDKLDRARLLAFRASVIAEAKGKDADKSEHTVNRHLRSVATILGYLRKAGVLAKLSGDDIADGLERLRAAHDVAEFLRAAECGALLAAALKHDAAKYALTREEHARGLKEGQTPRYDPIAPFTFAALATGARLGELVAMDWRDVDLDAKGEDGAAVGEIRLRAAGNKTKRGRIIDLSVSPMLRELLDVMRPSGAATGPVFGVTYDGAIKAGRRLSKTYNAPETFSWQACRRTTSTFLTNAPGIFGAASAYRSARQLGHSVKIAEGHYAGLIRGISPDAKSLEAAMQIESQARATIEAAKARKSHSRDRLAG